jgi:hypothetical protein
MDVMKTVSTKSGKKAMASSLPVLRERKILKTSWHLAGGRTHVDIEGLTGLTSKSGLSHALRGVQEGLIGLASKPEALRCGQMVEMEGTWRHHVACVEAKQSREGGVSVRVPIKYWMILS